MTAPAFREAVSHELDAALLAQLLDLGHACWPDGSFTEDDLQHALGGRHFLAEDGGRLIAHASVVPRVLEVDGQTLRGGYLEAVAALPRFRHQGIATRLVVSASAHIDDGFDLGALSTSRPAFYERIGWRRWTGLTFVRERDGTLQRTPDEDDGILWRRTPMTPKRIRGDEPIACQWRSGDVW